MLCPLKTHLWGAVVSVIDGLITTREYIGFIRASMWKFPRLASVGRLPVDTQACTVSGMSRKCLSEVCQGVGGEASQRLKKERGRHWAGEQLPGTATRSPTQEQIVRCHQPRPFLWWQQGPDWRFAQCPLMLLSRLSSAPRHRVLTSVQSLPPSQQTYSILFKPHCIVVTRVGPFDSLLSSVHLHLWYPAFEVQPTSNRVPGYLSSFRLDRPARFRFCI